MLEAGMEPIRGYELIEKLGRGGSGEVWLATAPCEEEVALKFIHCRNRSSISLSKEVRVLLRLREVRHPNIIELKDVFATTDYLVLCMELADGDLRDLQQAYQMETRSSIPPDHLLELLEQAAHALDFLASQPVPSVLQNGKGMQHCDVKPSNLLLIGDVLKVADFGLCMSSLGRTLGNSFIGTPPYAAPELYKGSVTAQTDQYGLAVTWADLCTGGRVFAENIQDSLTQPIMPIDPKKLRQNEVDVVMRALDPDWTNRWESCAQFITEIRKAMNQPRAPKPRTTLSGTRSAICFPHLS